MVNFLQSHGDLPAIVMLVNSGVYHPGELLKSKDHYKVGPLPDISRVTTPLIGVITPVTHL